jgi:hypothetical protein
MINETARQPQSHGSRLPPKYLTARTGIYRIRLLAEGIRP